MSYAGSVCRPCQIGCYEAESRAHMPPGLWRCPDCLRCYRGEQEIGTEEWELAAIKEGVLVVTLTERERAILADLSALQVPTSTTASMIAYRTGVQHPAPTLVAMERKGWVQATWFWNRAWITHITSWAITEKGRAALAAEEATTSDD